MLGQMDGFDRGLSGKGKAAERCAVNSETIGGLGLGVEEALEVLFVRSGLCRDCVFADFFELGLEVLKHLQGGRRCSSCHPGVPPFARQ